MSAAGEAQPSESPQGLTLRESQEADARAFGERRLCGEAEAMSVHRPARRAR